jgi:serine protease
LVAGTVALMLSVDPTLTPLQVKLILQGTARPFPTTGATSTDGSPVLECTAPQYNSAGTPVDQDQCYCSTGTCGAGMLDAGAAVANTNNGGIGNGLQARIDLGTSRPLTGQALALIGTNSIIQAGGSMSYAWSLLDSGGNVVTTINNASQATASVTPRAPGRFKLRLTVTDLSDTRFTSSSDMTVVVSAGSAPVLDTGTSGGGAFGAAWLALLGLAVLALRSTPRRNG